MTAKSVLVRPHFPSPSCYATVRRCTVHHLVTLTRDTQKSHFITSKYNENLIILYGIAGDPTLVIRAIASLSVALVQFSR